MELGLILPSYRPGATAEGIDAATETAARLGFSDVWTTDHVLVSGASVPEYGHLFEAVTTLAYLGGRHPGLKLGASVIVVPLRDSLVLAKELATIDALTGGRLIVGVGVGWDDREFANLGLEDRFRRRGAYLDETISLWRHLWGGSGEPFHGRFHRFEDHGFSPLPAQGADLPIWVGGASEPALARAGRAGDGYQASQSGPQQFPVRGPVIRAAAEAAGRPPPRLSARVRVHFGPWDGPGYRLAGTPEQMLLEIRAFADAGVDHLAVDLGSPDAERHAGALERFHREVMAGLPIVASGRLVEAAPSLPR